MNTPVTIDWIVSNVDELLEANFEYTEDTKALRLFIRGKLTESLKHGIALRECVWNEDAHEELYSTSCGRAYVFTDGLLKDNNVIFCPFCGGRIVEQKPEDL